MSKMMRTVVDFPLGLTTNKTATNNNEVANLAQVYAITAGNNSFKEAVAIDFHDNQDISTGGLLTEDSYTLVEGDRMLLAAQTDAIENGIYVTDAGGVWSRALDADSSSELAPLTKVQVVKGEHAGREYRLMNEVAPVVDTDEQTWTIVGQSSSNAIDISADETNFNLISGANVQASLESIDTTMVSRNSQVDSTLASLSTAVNTLGSDVIARRFTSSEVTLVSGQIIPFTHNLNEQYVKVDVYEASSRQLITSTLEIRAVNSSTLGVQNFGVDVDVIVVCII